MCTCFFLLNRCQQGAGDRRRNGWRPMKPLSGHVAACRRATAPSKGAAGDRSEEQTSAARSNRVKLNGIHFQSPLIRLRNIDAVYTPCLFISLWVSLSLNLSLRLSLTLLSWGGGFQAEEARTLWLGKRPERELERELTGVTTTTTATTYHSTCT